MNKFGNQAINLFWYISITKQIMRTLPNRVAGMLHITIF